MSALGYTSLFMKTIITPSGSTLSVTWNPLDKNADMTLSNGNLTWASTAGGVKLIRATHKIAAKTKRYYEVRFNGGFNDTNFLLALSDGAASTSSPLFTATGSAVLAQATWYKDAISQGSLGSITWTSGNIAGIVVDLVNGYVQVYKNGTIIGVTGSITIRDYYPANSTGSGAGLQGNTVNFGTNPAATMSGVPAGSGLSPIKGVAFGLGTLFYNCWDPSSQTAGASHSNNNFTIFSSGAAGRSGRAAIGKSTGKYYWEVTYQGGNFAQVGFCNQSAIFTSNLGVTNAWAWYRFTGQIYTNGVLAGPNYGSGWSVGDNIMMALDLDNEAWYIGRNGTWANSGVPSSGSLKTGAVYTGSFGGNTMYPAWGTTDSSAMTQIINSGLLGFSYSIPTGYTAMGQNIT